MTLGPTVERRMIADSVRKFVTRNVDLTVVRRVMAEAGGVDQDYWRRAAEDLGIPGTAVPEALGGSGFGYSELAVVFEELGRGLVPSPVFGTTALALPALLASEDDPAQAEYVPLLASGTHNATLAWVEDDGDWAGGTRTQAHRAGGDWQIDGHKSYVVDGASADTLLILAQTSKGPSLFAVTADADGLERKALPTFDQTRRIAGVWLSGTAARLVGEEGGGGRILDAALDRAAVLLAAEMVGAAEACLEMSVEYAKQREQYGRPIGSFQAIKHKCAAVLVEVETARTAVAYAAWAADQSPSELPTVACIAKATASEAFFLAAAENVQIHGGIGTTWEHDAHLYLKRAQATHALLGSPDQYRRRLADRLALQ